MTKPIPNSIAAMQAEMTEWRRDLHEHPELNYEEVRTAGVVAAKLRAWSFDEVVEGLGKTGVVGILHGHDGPATETEKRILLRADMDALPILEATGAPHASKTPGKMHACGHDGHTTMLLGAAKYLAETRNFEGTVYFIFQPAEEGGGGAKAMIDDGLLERWPVRAAFGMHNHPGSPVGTMGTTPGAALAYADRFKITIKGRGGHAAMPHLADDVIVAGAQLVTAFQSIISRRRDPMNPAVISITRFHAGSAYNVLPPEAELWGTVRVLDQALASQLIEEMRRQCGDLERPGADEIRRRGDAGGLRRRQRRSRRHRGARRRGFRLLRAGGPGLLRLHRQRRHRAPAPPAIRLQRRDQPAGRPLLDPDRGAGAAARLIASRAKNRKKVAVRRKNLALHGLLIFISSEALRIFRHKAVYF